MRLFAALPLSPAAVDRLTRLRLRLSGPRDGLRWSSPEQWHITLGFFGELEAQVVHSLEHALTAQLRDLERASVTLDRLDHFPAKGILFAAVEVSPSLLVLQEQILLIAASCGIQCASRAFRPHVTLARSKGKTGHKTLQAIVAAGVPSLGASLTWTADRVILLESTLGPQGAMYQTKGNLALGAPKFLESVQTL